MNDDRESFDAFLSIPYGRRPEEKVYWSALATAIRDAARKFEPPGPRVRIRSANAVVNDLDLKRGVIRLINECDFTIAVITGNNPNVFWEVGFTQAQEKPVVFLIDSQDSSISRSPVLVVEALKCQYNGAELEDTVAKKEVPGDLVRRVEPFLQQAINSVKATRKPPVLESYSTRQECKLPTMVAKARERIWLITTNLGYFASSRFFIKNNGNKLPAFDVPVNSGVEVKILTMDPESSLVKYRAEQLAFDYDVGIYREELKSGVRELYQRYRKKENVSIRLYDDLPLQIAILIDNKVVTSTLARGSRARQNLHFKIDLGLPGAACFEKHFSEVSAGVCKHVSTFRWATGDGS